MAATAEQIKKLRDLTGAGVLDAKNTLEQYNGDFDKALAVLKEKGMKVAAKKAERVAKQGLIETYLHGNRIGVLLEVNCETDFVARNETFKEMVHDLALQIAAQNPQYVSEQDVPAQVIEEQRKIFADAAKAEGKPDNIIEKIVQGKMDSWLNDVVLMRQPFIRDDSVKIQDLVKAAIAKLQENIVVRRFTRYALGE